MIDRIQRFLRSQTPDGQAFAVDGVAGPQTKAAWHQHVATVPRRRSFPLVNYRDLDREYGGWEGIEEQLVDVVPPWPMKLAWETSTQLRAIRFHALAAHSLGKCLREIWRVVYGGDFDRLQHDGLHLFGGSFIQRPMRGGTKLSRHGWGIALDLDPERNGNLTPWPSEAKMPREVLEVFADHGWTSYGLHHGRDAMHVQATRPEPF